MSRFATVFAIASVLSPAFGADPKIDEAIPVSGDSLRPVFVRMEDQLFRKAGDHEAFCKAKARLPRSRNRKEVTALLRKKADGSWKKINDLVAELEEAGLVRGPRRFWIVEKITAEMRGSRVRVPRFPKMSRGVQ